MANNGIRGITIQLGADTTGLDNALKDVNKQSKSLQSELKEVERGLKFDPSNTQLVAQKMQLLQQSVSSAEQKLQTLRTAQQQVEQQFQSGQIGEDQYRAFQREIVNAESEIRRLQGSMTSLNSEQERLGQTTNRLNAFFDATGTNVEQFADTLGTRLTQAIRTGSASADQMERALRLMGQQALGANTDIDQMRRTLNQINSGGSIDQIRAELNQLDTVVIQTTRSVDGLDEKLGGLAGGLAAAGGIAGIVSQALDASSLDTKIDISFNVPEESKEAIKEAIKGIEAYGIDGEAALEGIRRQWALNSEATDEANAKVIEAAGVIASAFSDVDFTELIQEANEIAKELGITNEEALGLTNSLLKIGFPPDQIDIIAEYGAQLTDAGFSAQETQAIMAAGVETGTWNIDNLLDGLKEGRIKLEEFGSEVPKAVGELIKGTDISSKQLQQWGQEVAKGGEAGRTAMQEVAKALLNVDDETKRNALGVQFFGTMWEDQSTNITDTLLNMGNHMQTTAQNQEQLNAAIEKINSDPMVQLKDAANDVLAAITPVLLKIGEIVGVIASWIKENSTLAAIIASVVAALGIIMGTLTALAPIFTAIGTIAGVVGTSIAAIAAPIGIAIAAITALIAIGVALWKNWDEVSAFLSKTWENIKTIASTVFIAIGEGISSAWNGIKSTTENVWNAIKTFFSNHWKDILVAFSGPIAILVNLIATNWDTIKAKTSEIWNGIKSSLSSVWEGIKTSFSSALEAIKGFVTTSWNNIKSTSSTVFNAVKSTITSIWSSIKTTISNTVSSIVNSVSEKMGEVKKAITTKMNEGLTFLKGLPSKFLSIGRDIINGLLNGIIEKIGSIRGIIEELASNIPEWMKNLLGIKSPAKIARSVKEFISNKKKEVKNVPKIRLQLEVVR